MTERQWLRGPAIASRARRKVCFPSGGTECAAWHYAPFLGAHERAVQAELSFLRQNLLEA